MEGNQSRSLFTSFTSWFFKVFQGDRLCIETKHYGDELESTGYVADWFGYQHG